MKCPKCKKLMHLVERYSSMVGESRLLFYCNYCDKAINTPIDYIDLKIIDGKEK